MLTKVGVLIKIKKAGSLEDVLSNSTSNLKKNSDLRVIEEKNTNDFLYFRAIFLHADQVNGNGDLWEKAELLKSYGSFVGKHIDMNHDTKDLVGKIIDNYIVEEKNEKGEDDCYVEGLCKVDVKANPKIARQIETGILNSVSMECSVETSVCSICGHEIHTEADKKCAHFEGGLNKEYDIEVNGSMEKKKCYSINRNCTFTGLGIVNVPADGDAKILSIISELQGQLNKEGGLDKEAQVKILAELNSLIAQLTPENKKQVQEVVCTMNKECDLNETLRKLNALEYITIVSDVEKKLRKEVKEIVAKEEVLEKKADEKIVEAKKEDIKILEEIKKADNEAEALKLKVIANIQYMDEARDIIEEWLMFMPGIWEEPTKEERKEKGYKAEGRWTETGKKWIKALSKAKDANDIVNLLNQIYGKDKAKMVNILEDLLIRASMKAIFIKKAELKDSYYLVLKEQKPIAKIVLGEFFTTEDLVKYASYVVSDKYKESLISFVTKEGIEKLATLKVENKKAEPKQEVTKMAEEILNGKLSFVKEGLKLDEAGFGKLKIWAAKCNDCFEKLYAKMKAKKDEKKEECKSCGKVKCTCASKKEEVKVADLAKDASAFDIQETIIIGDGFNAMKDKENKEIVVKDKDGKEVGRYPDAFGEDMVSIIKFFRKLLNLPNTEEAVPVPEASKGIPAPEEKLEEKLGPTVESVLPEPAVEVIPEAKVAEVKKADEKEEFEKLEKEEKKELKELEKEEKKEDKEDKDVSKLEKDEKKEEKVEKKEIKEEKKVEEIIKDVKEDVKKVDEGIKEVKKDVKDLEKGVKEIEKVEKEEEKVEKKEEKDIKELKKDEKKEEKVIEELMEGEKKEEKLEEKIESPIVESPIMFAKKEEPIKSEKEAQLEKEKVALEAELKAEKEKAAKEKAEMIEKAAVEEVKKKLEAKMVKVNEVARLMASKGLIAPKEADIVKLQKEGSSLLDARNKAFIKAVDEQKTDLLKMDNRALEAFESSIKRINKEANVSSKEMWLNSIKLDASMTDSDKWIKGLPWS